MKTSSDAPRAFSEETPAESSKVITRRQAMTAGILAALTGVVALESAYQPKVSAWISEFTDKCRTMLGLESKYGMREAEKLPSIEKMNIALSDGLSCDMTVNFRSDGKNAKGEDHHIPMIEISIQDLPPNPNGTKNEIHFILEPRMLQTPERGKEYFVRTATTTNFYQDPNEEDIERIRTLGNIGTENSVSDPATALQKFATPDLKVFQYIETMTDGEIARLARDITELSLVEYQAKQLESALATNSQE